MTPAQFIAKWQATTLSERSACQQHFLDLCELLGQPKPAEADPEGDWYCNLYNQRPTWLDLAHKKLDAAVFTAYGWPTTLSDDDLLARLLALNLARSHT